MDLRQFAFLFFLISLRCSIGQLLGCPRGKWQCDDGKCIPTEWRCDEDGDCLDGSDEMDCNAPQVSIACPPGHFACLDSGGCVKDSARCDGQRQCPSGSDEEGCAASQVCLDSDWTCGNQICIPKELQCNGENDCLDNSDEQGCGQCEENSPRCPEGICLTADEWCDGKVHCSDGSDEPTTCGRRCNEGNGGCSHVCVDEPWGALCACPTGSKLSANGAICEDVDECAQPFSPCMHYCSNTPGSFYCHCHEGFTLNGTSTCLATGNPARLLTLLKGSIGLLNLKSQQFEVIQATVSNPLALTVDMAKGYFYWADEQGSIYKTDGEHETTLYSGEPGISSLACDWLNGHIYWANLKSHSIYVGAADGSGYTTLVHKRIRPLELVLLPLESLLFWINAGPGYRSTLEKSWMDGSDRSSMVVLEAQSAHSLAIDVAARRLYWISDFKKSVETVKVDGSGRFSFMGLFSNKPALSLAVFENWFYWVDAEGLWRASQNQPKKSLLQKVMLPMITIYHEQQQPKGFSACDTAQCQLCLLTRKNPGGFICTCPGSKLLLPDSTCDYPRFVYATITSISMVEFKGREVSKAVLFTTDDGILSFDVAWYSDWLYWTNRTGQVKRSSLTQAKTEMVPSLLPACLIKVDQKTGILFWVSCDRTCIGITTASNSYPRQLYRTKNEIKDMYLDWLRGGLLWLEGTFIFSMKPSGGEVKELFNLGDVKGHIAFDMRAGSLLWHTKGAGLSTISLLQDRIHQDGRRWNISGSVEAAFEPYLLSLSDDVMTLWDQRYGSRIQQVNVGSDVFGATIALKDVKKVPNTPICNNPSVLCSASTICLSQTQLCDGKKDCPDGSDEDMCITTCPNKGDFKCQDRRSCVPRGLVCDGWAHCRDGSDELSCPTIAAPAPTSQAAVLKCRRGSRPCEDNRECVLYTHVCDGERDCKDGSDEQGCDAEQYVTKSVVPESHQSPTTLPAPPPTILHPVCVSPSLLCPNTPVPLCIPPNKLCDRLKDCPDGFDEQNCVTRCPVKSDFRCKDRRSCVSKALVCDGRSHCHDGSDEAGCSTVGPLAPTTQADALKCRKGSRPCRDRKLCVLLSHVCDGEKDCQDGSDEEQCPSEVTNTPALQARSAYKSLPVDSTTRPAPVLTCASPAVRCPDSSLCLSQTQFCDGKKDCADGSDENCVKACPYKTDFRCKDRRSCVSRSQVCDGRSHCHDGSDEVSCPTVGPLAPTTQADALKCRKGSRPCRDRKLCVLLSHVCDGEKDCQDGSDEEQCPSEVTNTPALQARPAYKSLPVDSTTRPAPVLTCASPAVRCPDSSLCLSQTQFCDGKKDCADGSDENCVKACPYKTDFRCKDRRSCVSRSQVCDGRSHCHDGSDEVSCPTVGPLAPTTQADTLKCRKGSRPCRDGRQCVLYIHLCDGEHDCEDGSDEEACRKYCAQDEFQCAHGKSCIPLAQRCDGKSQCQDLSDELDCWKPTKACQVRCDDNKLCVPATFLCDGERDCQDGTDEKGCEVVTAAPNEPRATNPPACVPPSVRCSGSFVCISPNRICDGTTDCPDGYDEQNCLAKCKNTGDFLCRDGSKCVGRPEVCDGRAHCPDGSDESQCSLQPRATAPSPGSAVATRPATVTCRKGSKPCNDGRECVLYTHVCDGESDCQDGSDEEGCVVGCNAAEFQCAHGKKCIPKGRTCDGTKDCQDGSDELNCQKRSEICYHHCDNNTRCVPETFLCDGERDCTDGSDEIKCGLQPCAISQYRCMSGQCVSEALRCDGYDDCRDHSDEVDCAKPPRCPMQLQCPHSHECLQKEWLCDGENDCKDGSDEKNCTMPPVKCREYQWQCGDGGQCIPLSWRCDGDKDCHNGADEQRCGGPVCPPPLYQCGSGECVEPALLCTGVTNCVDGSDEGPGCSRRNCSSASVPPCDHHCVSTPLGAKCYCATGFRLQSSGVSCTDIDECNQLKRPTCKHVCLNTRGSYICRCHPGFLLEPDNRSCKTKDEPLLLASVQSELLLLKVHSTTLRLLSSATRPVFSLDYHWEQQRIYWLSPDYQSIRWAQLPDFTKKGILVKGVKSDFIAVDWIGNNLYWVDGLVGQILAVRLGDNAVKPQNYTVVLNKDLEQPSSLVLLPHRGLMLWSEIGSTPQIERAGMDGSQRTVVVSHGLSWPVSLVFDLLDNRLYWADEKLRCIGSATLDGDDMKILQLAETPSPFSVAVFNDRLFWSDTKRRTIRSADKNTGKNQKVLLKRPGQPFGLKLMHPLSQPAVLSPCDQLKCSHLCLLAPAPKARFGAPGSPRTAAAEGITAVCHCPTGLLLAKDKITCLPPVDSAFILLLAPATVTQIYLHTILDGIDLKRLPSNRALALPGITEASVLDAAVHSLSMYVADAAQGSVDVLRLRSSRPGLTPAGRILDLHDDAVTGLAVDWVTANFYWSSTKRPDLHVTSSNGKYTASLLQRSLSGTTSIAVHPPTGRVCYTAIGGRSGGRSQAQVDCCYMDGRNRVVLWRKATIPSSLVFCNQGTTLYWADIGEVVISSIAVDGSGYKQYKTGPGLLVSFTRIENMLLWVTLDKDVTRLWFSDGFQPKQLWFEARTKIVALKAYSKDSQTGTNSCTENGGCSQLCLAYPGGRTCRCGRDFLAVNVTVCVPLPTCPPGSKSCSDGSKCVPSTKFCDRGFDCPDQSDEQDCPYTNSATPSSKSKELQPDKTPSSRPLNQITSGQSVQKDATSCDLQHCGAHGTCIQEGEAARCRCTPGYTGESCQEEETRGSHVSVVLGVLCVIIVLVAAALLFRKRKLALKNESIEKATLMANMERHGAITDFSESDSEDLESQVDAFPPFGVNSPITLNSEQRK